MLTLSGLRRTGSCSFATDEASTSPPAGDSTRAGSGTWGAAGYVITRQAAVRLLETPPELHCPVDLFLFKPGRSAVAASLHRYQVVPAVCIQSQLLHGGSVAFQSLVGDEGRVSPKAFPNWTGVARLIPWKKKPVPFRP